MPRTRCCALRFTSQVLDMLEHEAVITTWQHQLHAIPHFKAIFNLDFQPATSRIEIQHFTDELLVNADGVPLLIALVLTVHMALIEALGVPSIRQVLKFIH